MIAITTSARPGRIAERIAPVDSTTGADAAGTHVGVMVVVGMVDPTGRVKVAVVAAMGSDEESSATMIRRFAVLQRGWHVFLSGQGTLVASRGVGSVAFDG
jgi:hypothetical protein